MRWMAGWTGGVLALLWAGASALAQEPGALQLHFEREAPAQYFPGQPVSLRVLLSAQGTGDLASLSLRERIPEGWTFVAAETLEIQASPETPEPGQGGLLEFQWADPPTLPHEFVYLVLPPRDAHGPQQISGELEYTWTGGRTVSPPVILEIAGPQPNAPSLRLLGQNPLTLSVGAAFEEPGYEAVDPQGGDLSAAVQVSGEVNTRAPGRYTLTYTLTDGAGQQAPPLHRLVIVVPEGLLRPPRSLPGRAPAEAPRTERPLATDSLSTLSLELLPPELSPEAVEALLAAAAATGGLTPSQDTAPRFRLNLRLLALVIAVAGAVFAVATVLWRVAYATPTWRKPKQPPSKR